jgi:transglutaminase-like putative cysteine protease
MRRRFRLEPEEGWLTLGLVLLICLTLAWSVDAVPWIAGRDEYLDYLVWAAAGGVLVGFIGPKVGWGRWLTYLIGAVFAALLLPLLTGLVGAPEGSTPHDLFTRTADASVRAFVDLVILREPATVQILHHVLVFGVIIWGTSMFASYAVFGHRRALNAVVIVGVLLVGNMTFTEEDQLPLLVVYSLASLFLLIRTHVFDEQSEWLRRRIGDPASISSVYLRGGTAFITVTVLAAFLLTQTASSAPLAGAWGGVGDSLLSLSSSLSKYLPTGGNTRSFGLTFGADAQVRPDWFNNDAVAVVIKRDPTDDEDYYWRVASYDRISARGWSQSPVNTTDRPTGTRLLEGMEDDVDPTGLRNVVFQVIPDTFHDAKIMSPATPVSVGENVKVETVGQGGYYTRIERAGGGTYQVNALVAVDGEEPGQLNRGALLGAGKTYPTEIRSLYTTLPAGMWGPNLEILKTKVQAAAKTQEPIDIAQALERELRSSVYHYETDMHDVDCGTMSTAECFAKVKRGFCQWYAPTMVVVLRNMGIPARIAQGFLPGGRDKTNATEVIRNNNAHAWVEVYFPGYDWVRFDPTGGNLPGQAAPLPAGPADASPPPAPSFNTSFPPIGNISDALDPRNRVPPVGGSAGSPAGSLGPLVAVGILLLVVVSLVAFLAWRRGPRGTTSADAAYGMVTRIASRLGFGPRPNQTVYEYAGTLGDVLPDVRPELHTVAHAKVESIYAREILGAERLQRVREAQRRLRVSLLRLAFRRKERRRRRH